MEHSTHVTILNKYGLHARPAATLIQALQGFDADVRLADATNGRGPVPAVNLIMLATLDVPSVKNLRLTLQTMELLHFPKSRIRVVVNRADSKVGLRLPDVEKLLSSPVDTTIPSSRSVPLSVPKG